MTTTILSAPSELLITSAVAVLIALCCQLYFYLRFYLQPLRHIRAERDGTVHHAATQPPVSVIVYANNESESLAANLESLLEQDYPEYEVVVVNDGSADESEKVLADYQKRYPHLYHTFVAEGARNLSRRKLALTIGIKAAKHDILLLTNANCRPTSNRWVACMARNFTDKTQLVIGHTRFEKQNGAGQHFIAYDRLMRALRVFGFTLVCRPFTAEGSNLAYRKSLFFDNKGFAKYMHLHLGDDDLFVNQVAERRNTKVELDPESHMTARYESNGEGWRYLKQSAAFTSGFMRSGAKWLFPIETWSRYLFWVGTVAGIAASLVPQVQVGMLAAFAGAVVVRLGLLTLFWLKASQALASRRLLTSPWLSELLAPIVDCAFKLTSRYHRNRNFTWKL